MVDVTLRAGQPTDAESLLRTHQASILELGLAAYSEEQCRSWAHGLTEAGYRDAMQADETYLVAVHNDRLAGFCSYQGGMIEGLFVHPDFARHGVGMRLLSQVETDICAGNVEEIVLNAALPAVPFYEAQGYRTRQTSSTLTRGGAAIEYHRMFKMV